MWQSCMIHWNSQRRVPSDLFQHLVTSPEHLGFGMHCFTPLKNFYMTFSLIRAFPLLSIVSAVMNGFATPQNNSDDLILKS